MHREFTGSLEDTEGRSGKARAWDCWYLLKQRWNEKGKKSNSSLHSVWLIPFYACLTCCFNLECFRITRTVKHKGLSFCSLYLVNSVRRKSSKKQFIKSAVSSGTKRHLKGSPAGSKRAARIPSFPSLLQFQTKPSIPNSSVRLVLLTRVWVRTFEAVMQTPFSQTANKQDHSWLEAKQCWLSWTNICTSQINRSDLVSPYASQSSQHPSLDGCSLADK